MRRQGRRCLSKSGVSFTPIRVSFLGTKLLRLLLPCFWTERHHELAVRVALVEWLLELCLKFFFSFCADLRINHSRLGRGRRRISELLELSFESFFMRCFSWPAQLMRSRFMRRDAHWAQASVCRRPPKLRLKCLLVCCCFVDRFVLATQMDILRVRNGAGSAGSLHGAVPFLLSYTLPIFGRQLRQPLSSGYVQGRSGSGGERRCSCPTVSQRCP